MKLLRTIIVLIIFSVNAFGQKVTYNHIVKTEDSETKEVMTLFENYLASNPQEKQANPFWNQEEQEKHENFDFLEDEFQPSLYMGFPAHVLSIEFKKDVCRIKVQYAQYKEDGSPNVLAIVNYLAKKENGKYKLYNSLTYNREDWSCTKVGLVNFYYPVYYTFDYKKAEELNVFIKEVCGQFKVQPIAFEYYLADDYDEIQKLKGIDYYLGMGGRSRPVGKATKDKVYCGGLGEYYVHEVFHVQIDQHFPKRHFWASEGIATLLGGSRGQSLAWHIKRTNRYLQQHPEIDLNEMLRLSNLDDQTAYHYVLGGLIAKKVRDKGGWDLLIELMSSGKTDEEYYNAIEECLGVKKSELNTYLREQLEIESRD